VIISNYQTYFSLVISEVDSDPVNVIANNTVSDVFCIQDTKQRSVNLGQMSGYTQIVCVLLSIQKSGTLSRQTMQFFYTLTI
jgi:hypothetical protein